MLGGLNSEKKLAWVYTYGLEKLQKTVYEYEEVWEPELSQVTGEPIIIGGVEQGKWVEQRSSRTEQAAESYLGYTEATDAFGVQQEEKDGFATEVSYRGYAYDADTGKYVLPARYYDPELGRFLQEDGYWGPGNNQRDDSGRVSMQIIYQSVNLYVYCLNDPVNHTDFNGAVVFGIVANAQAGAGIGVTVGVGLYIDTQGNFMIGITTGLQIQFGASASISTGIIVSSSDTVYDMEGWSFNTTLELALGGVLSVTGALDANLDEISVEGSGGISVGVGVSLTGVTYSNQLTYTQALCSGNLIDIFTHLVSGQSFSIQILDGIYTLTRTEGGIIISNDAQNVHIWGFGEDTGIKVKVYDK